MTDHRPGVRELVQSFLESVALRLNSDHDQLYRDGYLGACYDLESILKEAALSAPPIEPVGVREVLEEALHLASDEHDEVFGGDLRKRESAIIAWKRKAQAALAAKDREAFGLAATQCNDPLPAENGDMLCGTVEELKRQLAAKEAVIAFMSEQANGAKEAAGKREQRVREERDTLQAELAVAKEHFSRCIRTSEHDLEQAEAELARVRGEHEYRVREVGELNIKLRDLRTDLEQAKAQHSNLAKLVEGLPKYESVKTYAGFTNDVKVYGLLLDDKEAAIEQYRELADALARLLAYRWRVGRERV